MVDRNRVNFDSSDIFEHMEINLGAITLSFIEI